MNNRGSTAKNAEKGTTDAGLAEVWPEVLMLVTMGVVLALLCAHRSLGQRHGSAQANRGREDYLSSQRHSK